MIPRALSAVVERGIPGGRAWSRVVGRAFDPRRTLRTAPCVSVIGVGGATRGGSGRTPVAIALARALARDHDVAFVAHGYGAVLDRARSASANDDPRDVGDETAIAAAALAGVCEVFVGPRQDAIDLAAARAKVVVVDGLLQAKPTPLACSVLAVDHDRPFGAEALPPFGDLVAPPAALRACADLVVRVGSSDAAHRVSFSAEVPSKVGLVTSAARPERIFAGLAALSIFPCAAIARGDHAPFAALEVQRLCDQSRHLDAWLLDPKSAALLGARAIGAPTIRIAHEVVLAKSIVDRVSTSIARR